MMNGAGFGLGMVGQAFSLDGVNDYVHVGEPPDLEFMRTGDFTIDAWFRVPESAADQVVVSRGDTFGGQQNRFIQVHVDNFRLVGVVRGDAGEPNTVYTLSSTDLSPLSFVHFAFLRRKGVRTELYVNGRLDTVSGPDVAGDITFSASRPLSIGASNVGASGGPTSFFDGLIDEVQIFARALSECEIKTISEAGSTGVCKNDTDLDGQLDFHDNCPTVANPSQANVDGDSGQTRWSDYA